MEIAKFYNETWCTFYSVSGESLTPERDLPNNIKLSYSVEGAYNFLKLCFYFTTWKEDWKFVLELLHGRLSQWLNYLASTQHMSNLWTERIDIQSETPEHDNIANGRQILRAFPQYRLSDFALLWLCFLQLEQLVETIHELCASIDRSDDRTKGMIQDVRKSLESVPKTISRQELQSNLLKTFKVSKETLFPRSASAEKNTIGSGTDIRNKAPNGVQAASSADYLNTVGQSMGGQQISLSGVDSQENSSVVFQRTIHNYNLEIQSSDMAVLEASIHGLFERSTGVVEASWHESLKLQQNVDPQKFKEPLYAALVLWAFRLKIYIARSSEDETQETLHQMLSAALYDSGVFARLVTEEGPETMKSWTALTYEILSLYLGSRFDQCTMTP